MLSRASIYVTTMTRPKETKWPSTEDGESIHDAHYPLYLTVVDGCLVVSCCCYGWRYWINFPWASIKMIVCSQIDRFF